MPIHERLSALPRAVRWAIFAGIVMIVFFAAVDPALAVLGRFDARAEVLSIRLRDLEQQLQDRQASLDALTSGLVTHGPVTALRPAGVASVRANAVVGQTIMDLASIEGSSVGESEFGLQDEALAREFAKTNEELVRVVLNFSFTATPEDVIEAIRRFEQSPEIHAVSDVRLRLAGDRRMLSTQLVLETWALRERGGYR